VSCCEPQGNNPTTPGGSVSLVNVGGGIEIYKVATGPNPFELRTLTSTDGSVSLTQNVDTIDLSSNLSNLSVANEGTGSDVYDSTTSTSTLKNFRRIRAGDSTIVVTQNALDISVTCAIGVSNEGGSAEVYDTVNSTATNKILRTLYSSDATVTVTQEATRINLKVPAGAAFKSYFSEKNDIVTTNNTPYVVVSTMDAIAGALNGEQWIFVATCLICHPSGLTTINSRINWQIETSAGVWGDLETDINTNEPQTIAVGQRSSPRARTYQTTLSMNAPRLRLRYSMSGFVATGGQVEYAKVSGFKR